jgi:hypothetical protein
MRRLDIYLNDHLAGSTLGVALSRRTLANNDGTELETFLRWLHDEIVEDQTTLVTTMDRLGVDRSPLKPAAAWTLEKVARLKSNGHIRSYSPLSRLVELEALEAGVTGKRSLWQALDTAFADDERLSEIDFTHLIARADHQLEGIADHRRAAATDALRDHKAEHGRSTAPADASTPSP